MTDCIFCKIVAGEVPAHKVYEDDKTIAIMDIGHVNPGHTLVISKSHADTLMDLDEEDAAAAFRVVSKVAKTLEKLYRPGGMTVLQANRPAGFQTVSHFHLHVLPREEGDGVALEWPAKGPSQDQLADYAAKIRAAID
jgi:histidine triad (HIT) family protein